MQLLSLICKEYIDCTSLSDNIKKKDVNLFRKVRFNPLIRDVLNYDSAQERKITSHYHRRRPFGLNPS